MTRTGRWAAGSPTGSTAVAALQLSLLLAGPLGWLGLAYLGSLAVLFVAAFWRLDPFTSPGRPRVRDAELRDDRRARDVPDDRVPDDRASPRW